MNTKLVVSVCAVAALLAACNKREDTATAPGATTTPREHRRHLPNSATHGCSAAARRNTARRYQARGTATVQLASAAGSKGVPLQRRIDVVAKGIERQRRCLGGGAYSDLRQCARQV